MSDMLLLVGSQPPSSSNIIKHHQKGEEDRIDLWICVEKGLNSNLFDGIPYNNQLTLVIRAEFKPRFQAQKIRFLCRWEVRRRVIMSSSISSKKNVGFVSSFLFPQTDRCPCNGKRRLHTRWNGVRLLSERRSRRSVCTFQVHPFLAHTLQHFWPLLAL